MLGNIGICILIFRLYLLDFFKYFFDGFIKAIKRNMLICDDWRKKLESIAFSIIANMEMLHFLAIQIKTALHLDMEIASNRFTDFFSWATRTTTFSNVFVLEAYRKL